VTFSPSSTAAKLSYTRRGFTHYEPEQVRTLLGDAGFRDAALVSRRNQLGEFFCATGAK
jgi:hypothetical protein